MDAVKRLGPNHPRSFPLYISDLALPARTSTAGKCKIMHASPTWHCQLGLRLQKNALISSQSHFRIMYIFTKKKSHGHRIKKAV